MSLPACLHCGSRECEGRECLTARAEATEQRVKELEWFVAQVNQYVVPGEADTKDATFIAFRKLSERVTFLTKQIEERDDLNGKQMSKLFQENARLREALEEYRVGLVCIAAFNPDSKDTELLKKAVNTARIYLSKTTRQEINLESGMVDTRSRQQEPGQNIDKGHGHNASLDAASPGLCLICAKQLSADGECKCDEVSQTVSQPREWLLNIRHDGEVRGAGRVDKTPRVPDIGSYYSDNEYVRVQEVAKESRPEPQPPLCKCGYSIPGFPRYCGGCGMTLANIPKKVSQQIIDSPPGETW